MASQPIQKTVLLSQQDSAEQGLNINWSLSTSVVKPLKEITLIYYKSDIDAELNSMLVDTSLDNLALNLDAGASYYLQLQVLDGSSATIYSNVLQCTTPYALPTPTINSVVGLDGGLKVLLNTSPIPRGYSDSDFVEFVIRKSDNSLFWIVKNFNPSGEYILFGSDNNQMSNNASYKVACMYQPSASNTRYKSPSVISNTMSGTPSNTPDVPQALLLEDVFDSSRPTEANLKFTWARPSDFSEWSSNFSIKLGIKNYLNNGSQWAYTTLTNMNVTSYTFRNIERQGNYWVSVQYINAFGEGIEKVWTNPSPNVYATTVPDAPVLSNAHFAGNQLVMINFNAPAYTGNKPLTQYKIYKKISSSSDFQLHDTITANENTSVDYTLGSLTNGLIYSFKVVAVNSNGDSADSNILSNVIPSYFPSVQSVSVNGNTVNASVIPNGKMITKLVVLAIPTYPDASMSPFVISQDVSNRTITGSYTLSAQFSFPVNKYVVMINSESGSDFKTNV